MHRSLVLTFRLYVHAQKYNMSSIIALLTFALQSMNPLRLYENSPGIYLTPLVYALKNNISIIWHCYLPVYVPRSMMHDLSHGNVGFVLNAPLLKQLGKKYYKEVKIHTESFYQHRFHYCFKVKRHLGKFHFLLRSYTFHTMFQLQLNTYVNKPRKTQKQNKNKINLATVRN